MTLVAVSSVSREGSRRVRPGWQGESFAHERQCVPVSVKQLFCRMRCTLIAAVSGVDPSVGPTRSVLGRTGRVAEDATVPCER